MVLALALVYGLGLASVFSRELRPSSAPLPVAFRSRLIAVLEGVMAVNVTPAETQRFRAWVASGATREGYAQVEPVVTNNCASCHAQGGQYPRLTSFEDLQPLAWESASTGWLDLPGPRAWHLFLFPLLLVLAVGLYLRRTTWRGRKPLMGACALAGLADVAQWSFRQGRPEALGMAWATSLTLAVAMIAVVAVVLSELWGAEARP